MKPFLSTLLPDVEECARLRGTGLGLEVGLSGLSGLSGIGGRDKIGLNAATELDAFMMYMRLCREI